MLKFFFFSGSIIDLWILKNQTQTKILKFWTKLSCNFDLQLTTDRLSIKSVPVKWAKTIKNLNGHNSLLQWQWRTDLTSEPNIASYIHMKR